MIENSARGRVSQLTLFYSASMEGRTTEEGTIWIEIVFVDAFILLRRSVVGVKRLNPMPWWSVKVSETAVTAQECV